MNRRIFKCFFFIVVLYCTAPAFGLQPHASVDEILAGLEKRYAGPGFSVLFNQLTTLKAVNITDSATGRLFIKQPGKMRWEYEEPDRQIIISDGIRLWIYKYEDNQVMVGKAPSFFGDGKGAGFLSDIRQVRQNFTVIPGEVETDQAVSLKLFPRNPQPELADIDLRISKANFDVLLVITHNAYGDETRIELKNYRRETDLKEELFRFEIPQGADVIQMDE